LPAFLSSPLDHLLAALTLHANAETVRFLPLSHVGLERPLHGIAFPKEAIMLIKASLYVKSKEGRG